MPGCDPPRPETASSTHPATTKEKHEPAKPAAGGADHARQQKLTSQRIADMHCAFKDGEKGGLGWHSLGLLPLGLVKRPRVETLEVKR